MTRGFRSFFSIRAGTARERMIREHSRWLSRMVGRRMPIRIPVRRVSEGGFARLTATPAGREIAVTWWRTALERVH